MHIFTSLKSCLIFSIISSFSKVFASTITKPSVEQYEIFVNDVLWNKELNPQHLANCERIADRFNSLLGLTSDNIEMLKMTLMKQILPYSKKNVYPEMIWETHYVALILNYLREKMQYLRTQNIKNEDYEIGMYIKNLFHNIIYRLTKTQSYKYDTLSEFLSIPVLATLIIRADIDTYNDIVRITDESIRDWLNQVMDQIMICTLNSESLNHTSSSILSTSSSDSDSDSTGAYNFEFDEDAVRGVDNSLYELYHNVNLYNNDISAACPNRHNLIEDEKIKMNTREELLKKTNPMVEYSCEDITTCTHYASNDVYTQINEVLKLPLVKVVKEMQLFEGFLYDLVDKMTKNSSDGLGVWLEAMDKEITLILLRKYVIRDKAHSDGSVNDNILDSISDATAMFLDTYLLYDILSDDSSGTNDDDDGGGGGLGGMSKVISNMKDGKTPGKKNANGGISGNNANSGESKEDFYIGSSPWRIFQTLEYQLQMQDPTSQASERDKRSRRRQSDEGAPGDTEIPVSASRSSSSTLTNQDVVDWILNQLNVNSQIKYKSLGLKTQNNNNKVNNNNTKHVQLSVSYNGDEAEQVRIRVENSEQANYDENDDDYDHDDNIGNTPQNAGVLLQRYKSKYRSSSTISWKQIVNKAEQLQSHLMKHVLEETLYPEMVLSNLSTTLSLYASASSMYTNTTNRFYCFLGEVYFEPNMTFLLYNYISDNSKNAKGEDPINWLTFPLTMLVTLGFQLTLSKYALFMFFFYLFVILFLIGLAMLSCCTGFMCCFAKLCGCSIFKICKLFTFIVLVVIGVVLVLGE